MGLFAATVVGSRDTSKKLFHLRLHRRVHLDQRPGALKPSPDNFFVASMPSLLPLAISLVAWSSTSDGPLVKMLSRCGSVLAQEGSARAPRASVSALADRIGRRAEMVSTRAPKPTREGACAPPNP